MKTGFSKIQLKGQGFFLSPGCEKLDKASKPGDFIWWVDEDQYHKGVLREWQDSSAIIESNGKALTIDMKKAQL